MEKVKIKVKKIALAWRNWARENPVEAILLVAILATAAFLRFYRLGDYLTFLGDEGRDVLVIRRLLVEADPILIGPGTSIGNMYLGPLYYYLVAPSLFLARFSPVGPAAFIALLGTLTVLFVWWVGRDWFGPVGGLVASLVYAIAPTIIIYSRSSWNPNIMPFFALVCIYSIWQVWQNHRFVWLVVLGAAFAFVMQSHYLGLLLLPTILVIWLLAIRSVWREKEKVKKAVIATMMGVFIFLLLMSPLVIFDLRHNGMNYYAMKKFFTERQTTVSAKPWKAVPNLLPLVRETTSRLVTARNSDLGNFAVMEFGQVILWLFLLFYHRHMTKREAHAYFLITLWLVFSFLGLGVYKQQIYDHYYGFFFPAPFLLIGGVVHSVLRQNKKLNTVTILLLLAFLIILNLVNNPLKYPPSYQLQRTKEVAQKIIEEANNQPFNLAVLAERNYDDAYQYFLEVWEEEVVDIDAQRPETITAQLFVVCELPREKCQPTTNPKAEVANFGWSQIESQWQVAGVELFKLVHLK